MLDHSQRLQKRVRWLILCIVLSINTSLWASEAFIDYSIVGKTAKSILLFPKHKIQDLLLNKPTNKIIFLDLPYFHILESPKIIIAPHPLIRFMRISQINNSPDVVRVALVFHQSMQVKPFLKDNQLFLTLESEESSRTDVAEKIQPLQTNSFSIPQSSPETVTNILDQRVNLQFQDEDIGTILNALAVKFNLRIIADAGVSGKVTVNAIDVPLREVLKNLLLQRNYQYTLKGRELTVISLGQASGRMARELLFKELSLKDALQTISKMMNINIVIHESVKDKNVNFFVENLSLDELFDLLIRTNDLVKKPYNENTFIIMTAEEAKKFGQKQYRTFKLVNAKPQEIIDIISNNKGLSEKIDTANIAVNERINALSIYDTPENLDLIARIIESVDEKIKQAVIELKLLEINRGSLKQLGVNFERLSIGLADIGHIPKSVSLPATLEFLEKQNKAKVLASPKIRVVHGKKANIHIGEEIPVPQFTYEVSSQTLNVFERKTYIKHKIGINLEVTPEISRDNEISMELNTKVDSLLNINKDGQLHTSTKTTSTYVRIKDGETVVLGGLINQKESTNNESPSIVNRVPLLRTLFTHTKTENSESELIMLVTPHLVNLDVEDEQQTQHQSLYIGSAGLFN